MAKTARVVTGRLSRSAPYYFDITSPGAGTCDGAIIYIVNHHERQPEDVDYPSSGLAVTVYDGTSTYGVSHYDRAYSAVTYSQAIAAPALLAFPSEFNDALANLSTIPDGIRVTWYNIPTYVHYYVAILFFGGVSLKAGCLVTQNDPVENTVSYSDAGFTPQAGLFAWTTMDSSYAGCYEFAFTGPCLPSIGAFTYSDGTITQRALAYLSPHALTVSAIKTQVNDNAVGLSFAPSRYEITAVASDGFTIATEGPVYDSHSCIFLLVGGLDAVSLDDTPCPASTGAKSWEGPGFQPDLIVAAQSALAAYNTEYTTEDGNLAIGVQERNKGYGVAVWSQDNVGTTVTGSRTNPTKFIQSYQTTLVKQFAASFTAFDSLGYDLDYSEISSGGIGFTLALKFEPDGTAGTATPAGVSAVGVLGAALAVVPATAVTTGVSAAGSVGTVTASGGAVARPSGVGCVADTGIVVAFSVGALVRVSGVAAVAALGTAVAYDAGKNLANVSLSLRQRTMACDWRARAVSFDLLN